jgi:hypothetical protein
MIDKDAQEMLLAIHWQSTSHGMLWAIVNSEWYKERIREAKEVAIEEYKRGGEDA